MIVMKDCLVPDCTTDGRVIRGYCNKHYANFIRTGDPISKHEAKRNAPKPTCAVETCPYPVKSRGLCYKHYETKRRTGQVLARTELDLHSLLYSVGWTVMPQGCWEWNGNRNSLGYGLLTSANLALFNARAHRLMWEDVTGQPLGDAVLCHRCDNPPCVNPAHLFPGAQADNVADMMAKGRHHAASRTECRAGHDLTLPGARQLIRKRQTGKSYQACVECIRARQRRKAARAREAS